MISEWVIYWITRFDALRDIFYAFWTVGLILSILTAIAIIIKTIIPKDVGDNDTKAIREICETLSCRAKWVFIPALCFCLLTVLTPNTKEFAAIVVIPAVLNNEKVQNVGNNTLDLGSEWLKGIIKEIKADPNKATLDGLNQRIDEIMNRVDKITSSDKKMVR